MLSVFLYSVLMKVVKATEMCRWILIYDKEYFTSENFFDLPQKCEFFVVKLSYILLKITYNGRYSIVVYLAKNHQHKQLYLWSVSY
jgi:hypothetical protein